MSVESHLGALEKKHANVEDQIREMTLQHGSDNSRLSLLKRQKLKLKDEMSQLGQQTKH